MEDGGEIASTSHPWGSRGGEIAGAEIRKIIIEATG